MSDPHDTEHNEIAHVMPLKTLFGVGGALLFLTAVTVWVTYVDFGRSGNLVIALIIAVIKSAMVCAFFMHLRWDRPFNSLIFASCLLFVGLFISITLLDKSQYQDDIDEMYVITEAAQ
jgi:cytochrome c oxidase subunit IV